MTMQPNQENTPYVQLPELLKLFNQAPQFIANKPYKAVNLSENGQLMVEAQITEHMAAGLPTVAKEVTKGQIALINERQFEMVRPLLNKKNAISPQTLLDEHIEVMDVLSEEDLKKGAMLTGNLEDMETNCYLDPVVEVAFSPKDMLIPSFMDPIGVEPVRMGQLLVKTPVLGILPYERPYKGLMQDATFLNHHLPVAENSVYQMEQAPQMHQNFASMLQQNGQQKAQNTQQQNVG